MEDKWLRIKTEMADAHGSAEVVVAGTPEIYPRGRRRIDEVIKGVRPAHNNGRQQASTEDESILKSSHRSRGKFAIFGHHQPSEAEL
jgi:hypothetical protein